MSPTMIRTAHRMSAAAVLALLVAAGCGGDDVATPVVEAADAPADTDTDSDTAGVPFGLVTAEAAAALATSGVTVLDVRTPEEFAEGHLDGAQLIDFYSSTFADQIAALDPDEEYLVYCRSGNRSGQTVALMRELGIDQVWDLDGGVIAYGAAGLPFVR